MSFRKILFWIHLISGLIVGVVLLMMAVSGASMAFEPQITAMAEKKIRNVQPAAGRLSLKELAAKAAAQNSGAAATGVIVWSEPSISVAVLFGRDTSYMNPYTGEFLGRGSKIHDALHKVENFHRTLLVGETGSRITGAACFVLLGMALSGFYLWWPKKWEWSLFETRLFVQSHLTGKARDWNLHNLTGFWFAPLLLATTLTGLVMAYSWANDLLFRLAGSEPASKKQNIVSKGEAPKGPAADFDAFIESVNKRVPGWQYASIRLPREPQGPVTAYVQEAGSPFFIRSSMTLDSATAEILKWEPTAEQSRGRRWRAWVRPIHTGQAGGILGQTLALFSGLAVIMLVWTGFAMAWRRFFSIKKVAVQK